MATGMGEGNILDQSLGDSTMEKNMADGQPTLRVAGQNNLGGSVGCGSENGASTAAENDIGSKNYQCLVDG